MKPFMDNDFLLTTDTAKKLFHDYAKPMPILDYHCHIDAKEIAQDRQFSNITQVWLGGDHYKWRFMRSCGVEERFITGDAPDREKFMQWAKCLGTAIGNPLYHWSHLELQRYFGYTGHLCEQTAEEVWELCNRQLSDPSMSARNLIRKSHVTLLCTTDDPADSLEWHKNLREDSTFEVQVLPAFRPDKSMNPEKPDFPTYLDRLSKVSETPIISFASLKKALQKRMDFFEALGCRVSDHGLDTMMYAPASEEKVEEIFQKRRKGDALTPEEILQYKTAFLLFAGSEYRKRNWVMQLHYGCKRDNNEDLYEKIGADTGFDCINSATFSAPLADLLNALNSNGALPKTILYSLNPNDNAAIGTIIGCFQNEEARGKIQQGSAWWFNDHKTGIQEQLTSLAALGNLAGFVGMLTDSRSFLSYTRHEYFRRILCELLGSWVENGEYPQDYDLLKKIVKDICYDNAVRYFGFALEEV